MFTNWPRPRAARTREKALAVKTLPSTAVRHPGSRGRTAARSWAGVADIRVATQNDALTAIDPPGVVAGRCHAARSAIDLSIGKLEPKTSRSAPNNSVMGPHQRRRRVHDLLARPAPRSARRAEPPIALIPAPRVWPDLLGLLAGVAVPRAHARGEAEQLGHGVDASLGQQPLDTLTPSRSAFGKYETWSCKCLGGIGRRPDGAEGGDDQGPDRHHAGGPPRLASEDEEVREQGVSLRDVLGLPGGFHLYDASDCATPSRQPPTPRASC